MVNGMSSLYLVCNRGKRSIAVDVRTEGADVRQLHGRRRRPAELPAGGHGPSRSRLRRCAAAQPRRHLLLALRPEGPVRDRSAYDTVIQAYGGANQAEPEDGVPVFLRQTAADKVTTLASQAVTAALFAHGHGRPASRARHGRHGRVFLWADSAANDLDGSRR